MTTTPNTTSHTFKKYSVTLTWKEGTPYAFEVWDSASDGAEYYVEGMLRIKDDILFDYDGACSLPKAVAFALHESGIGFAPYALPDSLFL